MDRVLPVSAQLGAPSQNFSQALASLSPAQFYCTNVFARSLRRGSAVCGEHRIKTVPRLDRVPRSDQSRVPSRRYSARQMEIPALFVTPVHGIESFLRFPEFGVELERLLVGSLGFRSTAGLLEELTQSQVACG
jgi:hypothetical protein